MSDPQYGEPVDEPTPVEDVVDSANEGLAHAEAARGEAEDSAAEVGEADAAADAIGAGDGADMPPAPSAPADAPAPFEAPVPEGDPLAADATPADLSDHPVPPAQDLPTAVLSHDADASAQDAAVTTVLPPASAPLVPPSAEPVAPLAPGAAAGQPIFVQAPEPPRPRGNRGASGAIGLLAALSFAALYLAVWLGVGLGTGTIEAGALGTSALSALTTWALWVPVVVFFIAFWLLGAMINRGRWGIWVILGLLVGLASYGGHLLGALFQAPFWMLTASEGATLVEGQLLAPLAIAAFVIGRELTVWFGAWVAARGKRVTELNREAQREYERTLEAGPQLYAG